MDQDLFLKIIDELVSEQQTPLLMFSLHNEPLLDERIFEWVMYVKSVNPGCYSILPTNGDLFDKFASLEIIKSGLDQINISLNAYAKETYQQIDNGLDYEKIMRNIDHLLVYPALKKKMQMMFVHSENNSCEVQQAVDYWKQKGVRSKVVDITNRAGSLDTYDKLKLKKVSYRRPLLLRSWKKLMSQVRNMIGCELPFYQMNILFNGDVIICSYDWNRATIIGNVRTQSLKEIWNSPTLNDIRQQLLHKRYKNIGACGVCSVVNKSS